MKRNDIPPHARTPNGSIKYGHFTGVYIDNDKYPLDESKCGTYANMRAHERRGQEPCDACREVRHERFSSAPRMRYFV